MLGECRRTKRNVRECPQHTRVERRERQAFAHGEGQYASASVTQIGGAGGAGPGGAGRGADSELDNAAYAENPVGNVAMSEFAAGGASGAGPGSEGGDARARLVRASDHGDLYLGAQATGGAASFGGQGGDGRVLVFGRVRAWHERGFLDSQNAWLWTLGEDRVTSVRVYADPTEARRAFSVPG